MRVGLAVVRLRGFGEPPGHGFCGLPDSQVNLKWAR